MVAESRIGANVPVSNLDEAIAFYEGKLGLTLFERGDEHRYARFSGAGQTKLGIYESKTAGQARHTLASFFVDDVRAVVDALKANGVSFEEYEMPGMKPRTEWPRWVIRAPPGSKTPTATSSRSREPEVVLTRVERGVLLAADISGYTDYVVASPLEYAEDVVSDVTGTVVERLDSVIHVNKVEGNAAFGYALDGDLDATMLLDAIEECYFAFGGRLRGIAHAVSCTCAARTKVTDLDLKFVVHHGQFVRRTGARGEELTGNDVIVVHRLLKNGVTAALGLRAYALYTDAAVAALGLDPASLQLRRQVERYPDVGEGGGVRERSRSPLAGRARHAPRPRR